MTRRGKTHRETQRHREPAAEAVHLSVERKGRWRREERRRTPLIQITFIITLRSTLQWPVLHLRQRLSRPGRPVTAGQRGPRDEEKMEKMESRGKRWRVGEQK